MPHDLEAVEELAMRIRGSEFPDAREMLLSALQRVREETREECARMAERWCLVPPDGGCPTEEEADLCDSLAKAIRSPVAASDAPTLNSSNTGPVINAGSPG